MTIERRLRQLEASLKCRDTSPGPNISMDSVLSELGFDPEELKATAEANGQSIAQVVAAKLGMSYEDLQSALKMKANSRR